MNVSSLFTPSYPSHSVSSAQNLIALTVPVTLENVVDTAVGLGLTASVGGLVSAPAGVVERAGEERTSIL